MSGNNPVNSAIETKTTSITFIDNGVLPVGTVCLGRGTITVQSKNGKVIVTIPRLLPPASNLPPSD